MIELRVRKPDGWTTASFPDAVESISVTGGRVDGQLCYRSKGAKCRLNTTAYSAGLIQCFWELAIALLTVWSGPLCKYRTVLAVIAHPVDPDCRF